MTARTLHLAVAQLGPIHSTDARSTTLRRLIELLREAHSRGAQLVVFPELALTTFFARTWHADIRATDDCFERAMPNASVQALFDEARSLGVGFYLGYAELTAQGQRFNSALMVGPDGAVIGKYRKIHLPGHIDHKPEAPFQHLEKRYFETGDLGFRVWPAMGTRIGMCICNDRRWSETFRVMGLQSAELVVLGYNTPSHNIHWAEPPHLRMAHHLLLLRAHAHENALWLGAAAKCGREDGHHLMAGSCIVSPAGEVVALASTEDDEVINFRCDLALGDPFRQYMFNFAQHRRPEHYQLLIERTGAGAPLGEPGHA